MCGGKNALSCITVTTDEHQRIWGKKTYTADFTMCLVHNERVAFEFFVIIADNDQTIRS